MMYPNDSNGYQHMLQGKTTTTIKSKRDKNEEWERVKVTVPKHAQR